MQFNLTDGKSMAFRFSDNIEPNNYDHKNQKEQLRKKQAKLNKRERSKNRRKQNVQASKGKRVTDMKKKKKRKKETN